jgi:predicted ATPase
MTNAEMLSRAGNAKSVLDSPAYKEAYEAVRQNLLDGLLATAMSNTDKAEEFRWSIKLLDALKTQLDAAVNLGRLAQAKNADAEVTRKNPLRYLFR